MHQCEFCNASFNPRPQVKRPRACTNCQPIRQRQNEREWHDRHRGLYDKKYHQLKKLKRAKALLNYSQEILQWLEVGVRFFGKELNLKSFEFLFSKFFASLGIRQVNKFWDLSSAVTTAI